MTKTLLAFFAASVLAFAADTQTSLPRPAGEFSIHMDNGKQVLLSSYKGKVVLMAFFFTTCPHCQKMAGTLQDIQREYGPKGVQVLAGCFDENAPGQVGQFNEMFVKNAYPIGWDQRAAVSEFLKTPPTQQMFVPIITFIDRKGVLHNQYIGDETFLHDADKNIRTHLEDLLKQPAPMVSRTKTRAATK